MVILSVVRLTFINIQWLCLNYLLQILFGLWKLKIIQIIWGTHFYFFISKWTTVQHMYMPHHNAEFMFEQLPFCFHYLSFTEQLMHILQGEYCINSKYYKNRLCSYLVRFFRICLVRCPWRFCRMHWLRHLKYMNKNLKKERKKITLPSLSYFPHKKKLEK